MPGSDLFDSDALVAVLDSASSPFITVDDDAVVRYANPAAVEAFGYPREDLVGAEIEMLIPREHLEQYQDLRASWAEGPAARSNSGGIDLWARRRDGSTFAVEVAVTPVTTAEGDVAVVGIVDITARIEAERYARHLAAAHLAMAQLNDAAARATDRGELLEKALVAFDRVDEHAAVTVVRSEDPALSPWVAAALTAAGDRTTPYVGRAADPDDRVAVLPILGDGDVLLRVVVRSSGPVLDDPSVRAVLETMAANLSLALDRLSQRDRLRRVNTQRIDLFRRLLDAQDEERRRIADDVHDDSVQALAALQLRVGLLAHQLREVGQPGLDAACRDIESELDRVMAGLRALLFELEPVSTSTAVLDVVSEVLGGVPVGDLVVRDVEIDWSACPDGEDPALLDLPPVLRGQAARILKEALRNVVRHADATWVQVLLAPDPDGLALAVVDDGVGFPADDAAPSAPGHRGVASMLDRAAMCGGWCSLERDRDRTFLRFWLPRRGPDPGAITVHRGE